MQIKPIRGSNRYFVTDAGEVLNSRGRQLRPHLNQKTGYHQVGLRLRPKESKTYRVHRLVAEAFVPNPDPKRLKEVNHIDGNKQNNQAVNLEWVDKRGNAVHAYQLGLRRTKAVAAYAKNGALCATFASVKDAMVFCGVSYNAGISNCLRGKTATAYGYVWRYI